MPFDREDWGGDFRSTHIPEFTSLNPNALVPVIEDDGFVLWESNSIIRYLANRYGRSSDHFYPELATARARVDQWMDWQATELNNAWRYAFLSLVRNSPEHQNPQQLAASVEIWNRLSAIIELQLCSTGAYIAGEHFTLADIPIGLSLNRWYETPLRHPDYPALADYFRRLNERAGFVRHGNNGLA